MIVDILKNKYIAYRALKYALQSSPLKWIENFKGYYENLYVLSNSFIVDLCDEKFCEQLFGTFLDQYEFNDKKNIKK